jgi:hypothetical protein
MRARSFLKLAVVIAVVAGAWMWSATGGADPPPEDTARAIAWQPRELPDDPPGQPARPQPYAAAAPPVVFGPHVSIQVNIDGVEANIPGDAANEPSIAVDPTDPNRMAIGWRQFDTIASNFRQAGWGYSDDGGRTWTFPGVLDPGVFRSDPVLDFDANGNFYYNSLTVDGSDFTCNLFKSTDGGVTWGPGVYAYGGDKQWMTIDRTGGAGHGFIHQSWSIAGSCCGSNTFDRCMDGGNTFTTPSSIPSTPVWGTLAVASDGTLYVSGVNISDPDYGTFYVSKSTNAKNLFGTPTFTTTQVNMGGSLVAFGGTGTPNIEGLHGQVWIAVDRSSGPTAGNIYVLCSVDPLGTDPLDIHFIRSTDGGATWSAPVRVNDDASTTAWQWFGTMSVAPNGRIDVVWNDTRNSGVVNMSELYYSFSTDGGVTWSANEQLSPVWNSYVGWPNQQKIGDYYDMISDDVGANLAWAATFNGEEDVYFLRIGDYDCNINGIADSLDIASGTSYDRNGNDMPDECEPGASAIGDNVAYAYGLEQNVPNPFNPATTIRFTVPAGGGHVRLTVFDVAGARVRTLVDRYESQGPKSVVWNGTDQTGRPVPSGLYFYRLEAPGYSDTRKMLLLK